MRLRYLFISAAVLSYALLLFAVANRQQHLEKRNVVVLTVESLRDDMVTRDNTPQLLKAAQQATRFVNYRAVSGWTGTNIVSLLTGLTPFESGVHTRGQSVAPKLPLPLKQLKKSGYTVSGLQPFMAIAPFDNLGIDLASSDPDPLLWLSIQKNNERPFFFWYHYVHTHLPYTQKTPAPSSQPGPDEVNDHATLLEKISTQPAIHFDEALFTRDDTPRIHCLQKYNLQEFDQWFAEFWSFFSKGGFRRNTILVLTADHGDEHGERGMVGHASTTLSGHLHEEIVRIPLFIWLPDNEGVNSADGSSSDITASHIDIMVTLLHFLGIKPEMKLQGRNLFARKEKRVWTAMTSSGGFAEPDPARIRWFEYACLSENWKSRWRLYGDGRDEFSLYNLADDAMELQNLREKFPEIAASHKNYLRSLIDGRVLRPVLSIRENDVHSDSAPSWIVPSASGTYTYDSLEGNFFMQWTGSSDKKYVVEYQAGRDPKKIKGALEVEGNIKVFDNIGRRYWETWIVPQSPYRLRVKEIGGSWSDWVTIEAVR